MPDQTAAATVETLYYHHHGWLVGLLRHKLGNADHARDMAQDTFAHLLASGAAHTLREPRAYLTTLAKRLTAQYYRRQALERAYLEALAREPELLAPSPEDRLLVLEALAEVDRVLNALPERTRLIFLLSQLDELRYPEIAELLGLSVNAVQKAMVRALRHCYAAIYE